MRKWIRGENMGFETISPKEVERYLFRNEYIVIDIRGPKEYRRKHLKGAVSIPYERLREQAELLRHRELVLYCERGATSMKAARELSELGYRVKSMIGGIQAYNGKYLESYGK